MAETAKFNGNTVCVFVLCRTSPPGTDEDYQRGAGGWSSRILHHGRESAGIAQLNRRLHILMLPYYASTVPDQG